MRRGIIILVYLAGAIDMADPEYQSWKNEVKDYLQEKGIAAYDPAGAFSVGPMDDQISKQIVHINKYALENCDYALFAMSPKVASVGTPIEMYQAYTDGTRRIVVWLGDWARIPAYIRHYGGQVVPSFDEAVGIIANHYFDHG